MGTGKSTVGRLLADRFAMPFIDTDTLIEEEAGKPVQQIFSDDGEEHFRLLERRLMQRISAGDGRVIATGGGLLADVRSHDLIGAHQRVICLHSDPAEIARRLAPETNRPLLMLPEVTQIESLLRARSSAYGCFTAVDTSHLSPEQAASEIASSLDAGHAFTLTMQRMNSSSIRLERGGMSRLADHLASLPNISQVLVITDETVQRLPLMPLLTRTLEEQFSGVHVAVVPSGESVKTYETIVSLYGDCVHAELDRQAVILGVGGGVVCDIAGFVAATYLRGVRLALAPTTLLAQVDASIGGKTGVDLGGTKNLVGCFWPADLIFIDPNVLETLPRPTMLDGFAEIVKIGFTKDIGLVEALEALPCPQALIDNAWIIRAASVLKAGVVQRDPFEQDERMLLNFGHTIGHAIEAASDYRISHGKAVSIGMVAETRLAEDHGWTTKGTLYRLETLLEHLGLPIRTSNTDLDAALRHLSQDKKRAHQSYRLAVPTAPGHGVMFPATAEELCRAIQACVGASS